ncbi:MAG: hypothetical protein GXY33_17370 [Phycisphaerae bacterium]|nr:hypothetical protein [Phycisphaerae bacterium]
MLIVINMALSACSAKAYVQNPASGPFEPGLRTAERRAVDLLADGQTEIPAWIVAQMLDASDRLAIGLSPAGTGDMVLTDEITEILGPAVSLNRIFADAGDFRGRLCLVKGIFGSAENVDHQLHLPEQDHCWSVVLFDDRYRSPFQLFTVRDPQKFRKGVPVFALGYFMACRTDQPADPAGPQVLTVPVFMGVLLGIPSSRGSATPGFPTLVLALVCVLTAAYLIVRITTARSMKGSSFLK